MNAVVMPWWWLSFADETGFLGAAIVRGVDAHDAVRRSHRLGLNPGGEVMCRGPIRTDYACEHFAEDDRERLLTLAEIPDPKAWLSPLAEETDT